MDEGAVKKTGMAPLKNILAEFELQYPELEAQMLVARKN